MTREASRTRSAPTRLAMLFAMFYFIQGVAEPTEGLISQPVASLLKAWQLDAGQIGRFMFLLALPWYCKPVYGLLTDFVPLGGRRRQSYLVLASLATAVPLVVLYALPIPAGAQWLLLSLLLLPTLGVAMSDVVIDAIMVERGQPLGMTGVLQSVQWGAIWTATILTGLAGGYLSQTKQQSLGFLICGLLGLVTLVLALTTVRERPDRQARPNWRAALGPLRRAATSAAVVPVALFLFLWNFNPFASKVLYVHMTREMGFAEEFYGQTVALGGVAAAVGSAAYGCYCRRVPRTLLVHLSIVMGIINTAAYWWMHDEATARAIAVATGLAYSTALMVQLDLAARSCPPAVAGTAFALMMSLSNLGTQLSTWIGGELYERWREAWGAPRAFHVLVGVGAAFTSACWLLVPALRAAPLAPATQAESPT